MILQLAKLTYRPQGNTGWNMVAPYGSRVNKRCYDFLGLLYQFDPGPQRDMEGSSSLI